MFSPLVVLLLVPALRHLVEVDHDDDDGTRNAREVGDPRGGG